MKLFVEDYQNLVTSQHRGKKKFNKLLEYLLRMAIEASASAENTTLSHVLLNAIGAQLDTIGVLVGINRRLTFQPSDGSSPILDDENYRMLIQAKIAKNHWDGTNGTIANIWQDIFNNSQLYVQDNQDMTMTAWVTNLGNTPIKQELIANGYIVPKPEGVRLKTTFIDKIIIDSNLVVGAQAFDFGRTETEVSTWQILNP